MTVRGNQSMVSLLGIAGLPRLTILDGRTKNLTVGKPRSGDDNHLRRWRYAVFKRDKHACQRCFKGKADGVALEGHHVKPWKLYPELRYELSNGQTLCKECHRTTDSYGSRIRLLAGSQVSI
jgi:5-methylcytosine-specific restriction endonuclease McrA